MKTIGILGGMSWHSTAEYYRLINEGVQKRLGGLHSAKIILASVDFSEIAALQNNNEWDQVGEILANHALKLQQSGADFIIIATNTMHISVPIIEKLVNIPVLHIADATADAILNSGINTAGLMGTRFTMQMDYYKSRLKDKDVSILIPNDVESEKINRIIFDELCFGTIKPQSKQEYLTIIDALIFKGAECIIAGCTEITLLVKQEDISLRLFDTTAIHAQSAVDFALS